MKLTVNHDSNCMETEIIINCSGSDPRVNELVSYIRQYSFSLSLYDEERHVCQIPLEQVYYMESVDGKTYVYTEKDVYQAKESLQGLEEKLTHTTFIRINKACILNTTFLKYVKPILNHRLEGTLANQEKVIIARTYIQDLYQRLQSL